MPSSSPVSLLAVGAALPELRVDAADIAAAWGGRARARVALVIASDATVPGPGTAIEARTGAGAAAFVLSSEPGPGRLTVRTARTLPVLDRYRGDRETVSRDTYDPRLFREEVFLPETM